MTDTTTTDPQSCTADFDFFFSYRRRDAARVQQRYSLDPVKCASAMPSARSSNTRFLR